MIDKVYIHNFKCFKDVEIELNALTILAGANGVGKSSLIQSLLLVRQAIENARKKLFSEKKVKDLDVHVLLNGPFFLSLGNSTDVINSNAESNQIKVKLASHKSHCQFSFQTLSTNLSLDVDEIELTPKAVSSIPIFSDSFHYLYAERLGPRKIQEIVDQPFVNTGCQGEYTGQAIARAEDKFKLSEGDSRVFHQKGDVAYLSLRKQIEAWMDFVIPGIQLNLDIFPEINVVRTGLRRRHSETNFLQPYNIGFGITYVLPIIVSALIAPKGSMLIIENPEAHLHPKGQSRIGQFLARVAESGVQVIVETHSEHVINGARIAVLSSHISHTKVIFNYFEQSEKSADISIHSIKINERGDLTAWPVGFMDQEEQDLSNIFQLRNKPQ